MLNGASASLSPPLPAPALSLSLINKQNIFKKKIFMTGVPWTIIHTEKKWLEYMVKIGWPQNNPKLLPIAAFQGEKHCLTFLPDKPRARWREWRTPSLRDICGKKIIPNSMVCRAQSHSTSSFYALITLHSPPCPSPTPLLPHLLQYYCWARELALHNSVLDYSVPNCYFLFHVFN